MKSSETPTLEELQERFRQLETGELRNQLSPVKRMGLTDEAIEATRLVLAERGESADRQTALRCLQCSAPLHLEAGTIQTENHWLVSLVIWLHFYWSLSPVTYFIPDGNGKKRAVLREERSLSAGRCPQCGLIVFPGPVDEER